MEDEARCIQHQIPETLENFHTFTWLSDREDLAELEAKVAAPKTVTLRTTKHGNVRRRTRRSYVSLTSTKATRLSLLNSLNLITYKYFVKKAINCTHNTKVGCGIYAVQQDTLSDFNE